jgi:glycosyltransferase involved in cell wall biosynthesis
MLNHEYPPLGGGSGVAAKHLAEALAQLGHSVRVLTAGDGEEACEEGGVEIFRFGNGAKRGKVAGMRWWLTFLRQAPARFREALRDFRPDVVNSHFLFPAGLVVARTGTDVPHVATVVGADVYDPTRKISADRNWLMRQLARRTVQHAAVVTTMSHDMTNRTRLLFPGADVRTVHWGVPPLQRIRRTRNELGLPENAIVVATLCRLVRRKRVDLILKAISDLDRPDVWLVVMGSGPEASQLKAAATELGIAGRVRFTGRISEAEKEVYLGQSDIFCLPSDHEGFGLVFLEAMGVGSPVITTNVGGQVDIVRNNVDGFLIPTGDAGALQHRLRLLVEDPARLALMKQSATERAAEFSPQRTARAFEDLFEHLAPDAAETMDAAGWRSDDTRAYRAIC